MDKDLFKKLLSYLESSNGTNTQHPEVTSGIHEGTKAIGEYGLMPITAQEIAKSRIRKGSGTELDKIIQGAAPQSVEEILAGNPDKYNQYVDQMASKVMDRSKGNPEEAAMRWYGGPNSSPKRIRDLATETPSRVDKIQEFLAQNPGSSQEQPFVDKLLEDQPVKETLYNKIRTRLGGL